MRAFDAADLLDLYEVRALIEPTPRPRAPRTRIGADDARAAAQLRSPTCDGRRRRASRSSLNEEFHRIIVEAAGSPRLEVAMRAVAGIPRAVPQRLLARRRASARESLICHRRLVRAFDARDAQLAEAVMRMHILGAVAVPGGDHEPSR